jgi:hypothetical protein
MKKDKGCALILIIGLIAGMITGAIVGINVSTWNYAGVIAQGYIEVIRTADGGMFVNEKGMLYELVPVKADPVEDKILDAIEKHDLNMIEVEKAEIMHQD